MFIVDSFFFTCENNGSIGRRLPLYHLPQFTFSPMLLTSVLISLNYFYLTLQVYDTEEGKMIHKMSAHKDAVHAVAYSRDGTFCAHTILLYML